MNKAEFMLELEAAEVATQSQMKNGTPEIYFDEFEHWTSAVFRLAIQAACREGNRFPTIRMIHANKPASHATGALERIEHDRDSYKPAIFQSRELPDDLKNLTDDELRDIFFDEDLSFDTHEYHIKNFRKGYTLWVDMVRDALKSRCARKVNDEYVF